VFSFNKYSYFQVSQKTYISAYIVVQQDAPSIKESQLCGKEAPQASFHMICPQPQDEAAAGLETEVTSPDSHLLTPRE